MGKSTPDAPAAPDPVATSAAQTKSNKETALYGFGLSNPNYNTPLGSLNYTITNSAPQYDADAFNNAYSAWQQKADAAKNNLHGTGAYNVPAPTLEQYKTADSNPTATADVSLSPGQQQLYDQNTAQSIGLSTLAGQLQGRVGDTLNQPSPGSADFNTASQNAQDAYYNNQKRFLDPQFSQGQEQLDAKLANQGITVGSEAYNNEQNNFARQKQSAYDTAQNNAILQGPQNAQQLYALSNAARSQPLNEFNALRSQSQVSMPSFNATQPTSVAPTNVMGAYNTAYQGQQNAYNQQIASNNSMTGGLFGLGGSLGMAYALSDIRLKENIEYIGREKGHKIYHFNYIGDPEKIPYRGVMAHEVANIDPDAVVKDGEYYKVNYSKLGIEFGRVH